MSANTCTNLILSSKAGATIRMSAISCSVTSIDGDSSNAEADLSKLRALIASTRRVASVFSDISTGQRARKRRRKLGEGEDTENNDINTEFTGWEEHNANNDSSTSTKDVVGMDKSATSALDYLRGGRPSCTVLSDASISQVS